MKRTVEWLNQNGYRSYPLVEDTAATLAGVDFPTDLLLDLLLVDYTQNRTAAKVYLRNVTVAGSDVSFNFGLGVGNSVEYTIAVPKAAALPYEANIAYSVGTSKYNLTLVLGNGFDTVAAWADGTYTVVNGCVENALCLFQTKHRVDSLAAGTGAGSASGGSSGTSDTAVTGIVYFKEGAGIAITITPDTNQVQLDAYPGAGAGYSCIESLHDNTTLDTSWLLFTHSNVTVRPTGYVIVDGHIFQFGDPPGGSSGSGSYSWPSGSGADPWVTIGGITYIRIDESSYIDEHHNIVITYWMLTNLSLAVGNILSVNVTVEEHPEGEFNGYEWLLITLASTDTAKLYNSSTHDDNVTLELHPAAWITEERPSCSNAILYVNDKGADGYGNFQLEGGPGIEIVPDPDNNTIYIRNKLDMDNVSCGKCRE